VIGRYFYFACVCRNFGVWGVILLITEILVDMTEEEAKAKGFNSLEEFRKE
jgi:hypothetical protein